MNSSVFDFEFVDRRAVSGRRQSNGQVAQDLLFVAERIKSMNTESELGSTQPHLLAQASEDGFVFRSNRIERFAGRGFVGKTFHTSRVIPRRRRASNLWGLPL